MQAAAKMEQERATHFSEFFFFFFKQAIISRFYFMHSVREHSDIIIACLIDFE